MNRAAVTLVDFDACNLLNVKRAFEYCGANVTVASTPEQVTKAERLVLPGVGAFAQSMTALQDRALIEPLQTFVKTNRPFLGICIGMQTLFESSEEFGHHSGLGLLSGQVKGVPKATVDGAAQRVPHIGWNALKPSDANGWSKSILAPFEGRTPNAYFVHSFSAVPADQNDILATTNYGGHELVAAVKRDNITATQFHPERSGKVGLTMLSAFLKS